MELWTEKYRPKKIEDLVLINKEFGDTLKYWKENKTIGGHLLLYGPPGTGKTSSVNVILNELGVNDYIVINGSDKTGIDDTRRVIEYASVPPVSEDFKVVVFEEFERLSPQAQDSLKYVLEKFSGWCRFIFTTNNVNKVTQPIISRCQVFAFTHLDMESFVNKIISILKSESITYKDDDVVNYINATYPDLRRCINLINQSIVDNNLLPYSRDNDTSNLDKYKVMFDYIHGQGSLLDLQKYLATSFQDNDFENVYRIFYNNLGIITNDVSKWDNVLICIAEYLIKNDTVAFKDLNLAACICQIKTFIQ